MSKVILICGKICSGKSFYANQLKRRESAVVLSTDEVTYDLTGNEQGEGYDAFAKRVNAYLMKKAAELAAVGCCVILDWGFWTRKEREEATLYFRSRDVNTEWHYIDIEDEAWFQNIAQRNEKILAGEGGSDFYVDEGLLNKVKSKFETPSHNEMDIWHQVPDK